MGDGIVISGFGIDLGTDILVILTIVPAANYRHVQYFVHITTYVERKRDCPGIGGPPPEVARVDGQRGHGHGPYECGGGDFGHFPGHFYHDVISTRCEKLGHVNGSNAGGVDIHLLLNNIVPITVLYRDLT